MPRETMPATHDVIARQDIVCMAQEVLAAATRIVGDAHLALEDRHQLLYHQCGLPRTSTCRLAAYINMAARRIHPRDGSPHASMWSSNHLRLSAYIHIAIKSSGSHRTHAQCHPDCYLACGTHYRHACTSCYGLTCGSHRACTSAMMQMIHQACSGYSYCLNSCKQEQMTNVQLVREALQEASRK